MEITREFLQDELDDLQREIAKAKSFVLQAEGASGAYRMLIDRFDTPAVEPVEQGAANAG